MAGNVIDNLDRLFLAVPPAPAPASSDQDVAAAAADDIASAGGDPGCPEPTPFHEGELVELERFIAGEISERMGRANMTWRKLELCFKWTKLKEFLMRRGLAEDSPQGSLVRGLLRARQLTGVEYDARGKAVVRLNHGECQEIDDIEGVEDMEDGEGADGPERVA